MDNRLKVDEVHLYTGRLKFVYYSNSDTENDVYCELVLTAEQEQKLAAYKDELLADAAGLRGHYHGEPGHDGW